MHEGVFRALADPTRRRILELLKAGPMTAGEIAAHFPSRQPTISRHLGVLKQAGLVFDERQGQYVIYHLNATVLQSWLQWLWDRWGGDHNT
ncbi:MAG: autorepressor SdpR family transcription factor [Firmicutes bacterium]|nr:winged helix-turn-helix transcriptional regulator [Alicyclobacillaceae bacterium]MCL6498131.1 autorepressor SdpR family transcription factor [Bacillota bacterium]